MFALQEQPTVGVGGDALSDSSDTALHPIVLAVTVFSLALSIRSASFMTFVPFTVHPILRGVGLFNRRVKKGQWPSAQGGHQRGYRGYVCIPNPIVFCSNRRVRTKSAAFPFIGKSTDLVGTVRSVRRGAHPLRHGRGVRYC